MAGSPKQTRMETRTNGQEDSFFYYGKGMQAKLLSTSKLFTDYIGEKYGATVKNYMLDNKLIFTNRRPPKKIKKEEELKAMDYDDILLLERQHKKYNVFVDEIADDLLKVFQLLWEYCHQILIVCMRSNKEFLALDVEKNAGKLWCIITKLCNGTNAGEHSLRTAL